VDGREGPGKKGRQARRHFSLLSLCGPGRDSHLGGGFTRLLSGVFCRGTLVAIIKGDCSSRGLAGVV